jgi:hypothetical protein
MKMQWSAFILAELNLQMCYCSVTYVQVLSAVINNLKFTL